MPPAGGGSAFARGVAVLLACVALLLTPVSVRAEDEDDEERPDFATPALTSTWRVELGGSLNSFDTSAAWSPQGLAGAVIILEDALGLEEEAETFFVRTSYRFNRRHSLELSAGDLRRTASRRIEGEIEWGDYVFRADGVVASRLDTRIFKLKWKYDLSYSQRLNAGFTLGLSTFDLGLTLSGEARLEDDTGEEWIEGVAEGASVVAPVPVIGFFLGYAISPRWVVGFAAEATDLDLGSHKGRVLQTEVRLEYAVSDVVGLGLGLSADDLEYRSEERGEEFGIRYRISSLDAYLVFSF